MEQTTFKKLLLRTAFSCMACDGDIDNREVALIRDMLKDDDTFDDIEINQQLDNLLLEINKDGHQFLKAYFNELINFDLSEQEELKLIEVAINTIKADEKVEYSEVKFFKVIRSKLKINNESILSIHPDFEEYLEQDIISEAYLAKLQDDFFDTHNLPKFELLSSMDINSFKDVNIINEG